MRTTYIYGLFDPRYPEEIRYIGKADNLEIRLISHISDSMSDEIRICKAIWIRSLLDKNIKPEIRMLEKVTYNHPIEWNDREAYYIAYYFSKGHRLENSTLGGTDNFNIEGIRCRHNIWKNSGNIYAKYKLDEAIMYTKSNRLDFESAWIRRRDFYSTRRECIESEINLRVASHDVNKSRFNKLGGRNCLICGLSMKENVWNENKSLFENSYINPSVCSHDEPDCNSIFIEHSDANTRKSAQLAKYNDKLAYTPDGKRITCKCNTREMIFIKYDCPLYIRILSYDKTRVLQSDEDASKNLDRLDVIFNMLMDKRRMFDENNKRIEVPSLNILLVDDSIVNLKNDTRVLSNYGHKVETAKNGIEALDKWSRGDFDIILINVRMPGMDGIEATRILREKEKTLTTHTPIIVMIAPTLMADMDSLTSSGFDGHIFKPVRIMPFHEAVINIAMNNSKLFRKVSLNNIKGVIYDQMGSGRLAC